MKYKVFLTAIFFLATHLGSGYAVNLASDTTKQKFKFLYIVKFNNRRPFATENAFIDPRELDSIEDVAYPKFAEDCHLLEVDNFLVLKIHPNAKILTLNEFFNLYKVQDKYRNFSIMVDNELIDYPETILISKNQIDNVKIIKDIRGNYISIILKGHYELKKKYPNGGPFHL